jgi:CRISPR-associated protein Csb2
VSVTIAIRFPLGRYHATAWDRSVNEGAVEWPPSPWRLLRALVATWYTRWPDLPAPVLDGLLEALGVPPSYQPPPASPGHTRHYLPDSEHRKGETGRTDLTLDPFLWLDRDAELLVRWEAELTGEQREVLAKLLELMPYLGRADAVCQARLLPEGPEPDAGWWRPAAGGTETVRLLAPTRPVQRAALELGTVEVRRRRRTMPPESTWVTYSRAVPEAQPAARPPGPEVSRVDAIRFAVVARAGFRAGHGVLLADELHRLVTRALDGGCPELLGHGGAATDHRHAHWVPLADSTAPGEILSGFLVWVPAGLAAGEVAEIIGLSNRLMSGQRGREGYEIKGFPPTRLLLQAVGPVEQVAPELCGPARIWRSQTPYLPVRHRKRESLDDFLVTDVATELSYRGAPAAGVTRLDPEDGLPDRWAREFRRYRMAEHLGQSRRGLGLRLEFDEPVRGPLLLGQLSHFGFGHFAPEPI